MNMLKLMKYAERHPKNKTLHGAVDTIMGLRRRITDMLILNHALKTIITQAMLGARKPVKAITVEHNDGDNYRVLKVINSLDYRPWSGIEKEEVEKLCASADWRVTIVGGA